MVALVTLPLYIAHIGSARYGIIAIVWILLGYFGLIDFGLSRASANALAKLGGGSRKERVATLMTSLYINLALGTAGALALYFSGSFLMGRLLSLSDPLAAEMTLAFPWVAALLPFLMVMQVCRGAIESRENFVAANLIDNISLISGQILPLIAAIFIAPTLPVVLTAVFVARATSALIAIAFVARTERINGLLIFDRTKSRDLFRYGAWAGPDAVIAPVLQFIDQLFVGAALGATAVAHYAVPMNLVARSQIVASALMRATFPRFSQMKREKAIDLGERAVVSLCFLYGAMCASGIVLSRPFMNLWMGTAFAAEAAPVLEVLLMGAWINGVAFIPFGLLLGQGRPDVVAKVHMLETVPYVMLLWFMLGKFGIFGAAIAWNARVAIDAALMLNLAGFRARNLIGLAIGIGLMLTSYTLAIRFEHVAAIWSVALAGVVFLTFAGLAIVFDENVRRIVSGAKRV